MLSIAASGKIRRLVTVQSTVAQHPGGERDTGPYVRKSDDRLFTARNFDRL